MTVDGFTSPPLPNLPHASVSSAASTTREVNTPRSPRKRAYARSLSLHALAGVKASDARVDGSATDGEWPAPLLAQQKNVAELGRGVAPRVGVRLRFDTRTMATAIFVLIAALVASLTLLVIQSHNFEASTAAVPSATSGAVPSDKDADDTVRDKNSGGNGSTTTTESQKESSAAGDTQGNAPDTTQQAGVSNSDSPPVAPPPDGRIDINTADATQLDAAKGIGPAIAQKIIDYRTKHGPFKNVDGLLAVPGIGSKTLATMRDQLVVR